MRSAARSLLPSYSPPWPVCYPNPNELKGPSLDHSSQQNGCKSAVGAKRVSLLSHAPRKIPFLIFEGGDLKLYGKEICLRAFFAGCNLQLTQDALIKWATGKFYICTWEKIYRAEISSLKYTSKTERLYSTALLLHCIWKKILLSTRERQVSGHRHNQGVFKAILQGCQSVLYLWYVVRHISQFYYFWVCIEMNLKRHLSLFRSCRTERAPQILRSFKQKLFPG